MSYTVVILAPKSTVVFSTSPSGLNEGSKIDGGSHVLIIAHKVEFRAKIDNDNTRVWVVLTKHNGNKGSLKFMDNIGDHPQVQWFTPGDGDLASYQAPKNRPEKVEKKLYAGIIDWIRLGFKAHINEEDLKFLEYYNNNEGK